MSSFPVLRTRLSVCFLSPFPDSLPQLFLRCFPLAFAFGLFPFRSAFFRPLPFRFRLLSLCFFLSSLFPSPPHSGFPGAPFRFRFLAFPVLPSLVSHAFFPGFRTRLSVCFLSSFPVSLPQPFHRCLPSAFASCIFRFWPAFFRPLAFRFQLLSLLLLPFRSSRFRLTVASPVRPSAFASWLSPFSPA